MDSNFNIALITGAAGSFGKEIVTKLLEKNYIVYALDINKSKLDELFSNRNANKNLKIYEIDLGNSKEIKNVVNEIYENSPYVNILINCAGFCTGTTIWEIDTDEWDKTYSINIKAPFFLSQIVGNKMKTLTNVNKRIINISSLVSFTGGILSSAAYSSSKAALTNTTKNFAKALASYNVTVNEIAPGTADTELARGFIGEKMEGFKDLIPLGRLCTPKDVANAVLFLISEEANYITGQVLHVSGGMYI